MICVWIWHAKKQEKRQERQQTIPIHRIANSDIFMTIMNCRKVFTDSTLWYGKFFIVSQFIGLQDMKETLTKTDHGEVRRSLLISTSYLISFLKITTKISTFSEILIIPVLSINELRSKVIWTLTVTVNNKRLRFRSVKIIDDRWSRWKL